MQRHFLILILCTLITGSFSQAYALRSSGENFRVTVRVLCEDEAIKSLIDGYVTQGLASLGDINIVSADSPPSTQRETVIITASPFKAADGATTGYAVSALFCSTYNIKEFKDFFIQKDKDDKAITYLSDVIFNQNRSEVTGNNLYVVHGVKLVPTLNKIIKSFNDMALEPQRRSDAAKTTDFERDLNAYLQKQ